MTPKENLNFLSTCNFPHEVVTKVINETRVTPQIAFGTKISDAFQTFHA